MTCPHCGHDKAWRNGHRDGTQRWLCKDCGREYLEPALNKAINRPVSKVLLTAEGEKQAEKLVGVQSGSKEEREMQTAQNGLTGGLLSEFPTDLQAKVLQFAIKRENNGRKDVKTVVAKLRLLQKNGADLYDPENVKEVLKKMPVKNTTKTYIRDCYQMFLKFLGGTWEKPVYTCEETVPFIPTEAEIDQLIAALSRQLSTFCQILKETGARPGELARSKWPNIDCERRLIYINEPEKGSKSGVYKVTEKCIAMIDRLPRKRETIFPRCKVISGNYDRRRKRIAYKLGNPRIMQISFKTFRHWKGTTEAYKVRDLFHVQRILRHKSAKNTEKYIHWAETILGLAPDTEYTTRVATTLEEYCKLLEAGFTYVSDYGDAKTKILRKRK